MMVQNRITGQLEEERMQIYVRLRNRSLLKDATSRMKGGCVVFLIFPSFSLMFGIISFLAWHLLKSLPINQRIKYDPLESTRYITPFIASCEMNVDEILNLPDFSASLNFFLPAVLLRGETEDGRGPLLCFSAWTPCGSGVISLAPFRIWKLLRPQPRRQL